jgi:hypothetical protein
MMQQQQQQQHVYSGQQSLFFNNSKQNSLLTGAAVAVATPPTSSHFSSPVTKQLQQNHPSQHLHHQQPVKADKPQPRHQQAIVSPTNSFIPINVHQTTTTAAASALSLPSTDSQWKSPTSTDVTAVTASKSSAPILAVLPIREQQQQHRPVHLLPPRLTSPSSITSPDSLRLSLTSPSAENHSSSSFSSVSSAHSDPSISTSIPVRLGPEKMRKKQNIENEDKTSSVAVVTTTVAPLTKNSLFPTPSSSSSSIITSYRSPDPSQSSSTSATNAVDNDNFDEDQDRIPLSNAQPQTPSNLKRRQSPGEVLMSPGEIVYLLRTDTNAVPNTLILEKVEEEEGGRSIESHLQSPSVTGLRGGSNVPTLNQNLITSSQSKDEVLPLAGQETTVSTTQKHIVENASSKPIQEVATSEHILPDEEAPQPHSLALPPAPNVTTSTSSTTATSTNHKPLRPRKPASTAPLSMQILSPATRKNHESVPTSIYWSDSFRPFAAIVGDHHHRNHSDDQNHDSSPSTSIPSIMASSIPNDMSSPPPPSLSLSTKEMASSTPLPQRDENTMNRRSTHLDNVNYEETKEGLLSTKNTLKDAIVTPLKDAVTPHSLPSVKELLTVLQSQMHISPTPLKTGHCLLINKEEAETDMDHERENAKQTLLESKVNKEMSMEKAVVKENEREKSNSSLAQSEAELKSPTLTATAPQIASNQIVTSTVTSIASAVTSPPASVHHIRRGAGLRFSSFGDSNANDIPLTLIGSPVENNIGTNNEERSRAVSELNKPLENHQLSPVVAKAGGGGGEEESFIVEFIDDSDVWGEKDDDNEESGTTTIKGIIHELDGLVKE